MSLKPEVFVAGRRIADDAPVYIIGEMACGHQGNLEHAFKLVDAAVMAGADCIQIQVFETKANMSPTSPLYGLLEELYFTPTQWSEIMNYTRQFDIGISVFVYDEPSLDFALDLKPDMLKLNSSELGNPPMLIGAAKSGLPFTLGTGASSLDEIRRAVDTVLNHGGEDLILMHGVQNFPTPLEAANLAKIRRLKDEFDGLVIYADHTNASDEMARWIDLLAIGYGAAMLEKHIILDRSSEGVDWQAALEPEEFSQYVAMMRRGWDAIGPYDFQEFSDGELKYRRFQKKSLVAARDLKAGEKLQKDDVRYLRVQGENEGISPYEFESVARGRRLARDIECFQQILSIDLLEDP
ncbi:MAG: N-acetylneuraminate synthase family protein [Alphaproteobacteria bacterium]|nr:N-acetylneuraminate synthase family protein [Alphaproteobacteria bacterium]